MRSLLGPIAERTIQNFHCDIAFIGADSIDPDLGIYTPLLTEASLSRTMIEIAKKVIVVVDSAKFDRKSLVKISGLQPIDVIITDKNISETALEKLRAADIEMVVV